MTPRKQQIAWNDYVTFNPDGTMNLKPGAPQEVIEMYLKIQQTSDKALLDE